MDRLKLAALGERLKLGGERLKIGGAEMGRKVSGKMKEILQVQSQEAKMVDEATSDSLEEPNWGLNMRICGFLNSDEFNGSEVVRAIKKKIASRNAATQRLSLDLLETCAMNCDKVFSEVASEKLLEEMVRMIDNPQTHYNNRNRALQLIEAWGKSEDLEYLPVFKQTYMNLKARKETSAPRSDENLSNEPGIHDETIFPHEGCPSDVYQQDSGPSFLAHHAGPLSVEEKREILVITQNSIEILSSMLNPEVPQNPIKDDLTLSMLEKCKQSQPVIQRIIESTTDDEALLLEALSLHDELEQILSKHAGLEVDDQPPRGEPSDDSGTLLEANASDEKEAGEQGTTVGQNNSEVVNASTNMEGK